MPILEYSKCNYRDSLAAASSSPPPLLSPLRASQPFKQLKFLTGDAVRAVLLTKELRLHFKK